MEMITLSDMASRFQALADPTRLDLLRLVHEGDRTATDCIAALGLSQPRIARHLKILVDSGFLERRREGRFAVYSLAADAVTLGLIDVLIEALPGIGGVPVADAPTVESESRPRAAGAARAPRAPRIAEISPVPANEAEDEPPSRSMEDFLL